MYKLIIESKSIEGLSFSPTSPFFQIQFHEDVPILFKEVKIVFRNAF